MEIEWPQWPTYPSGRSGEWYDLMRLDMTDVVTYRAPDRGIIELMRNDNSKTRCDDWLWSQEEMLEGMTDRQREVVELRMDGYLQCEIAEMVGRSQPAVSQRIQAGQGRIENLIKSAEFD